MANLRLIKFNDFITLQRGFDLPKKDMIGVSYPVVGSTSIIGYHNEYKVLPPGVVTGRSGSLGEIQYIREKYWPHNTSLWVKDFKGNFPKYIYYFLKTLDLKRFNSGVGVPTLNRNDLDTLEVAIHDHPTQFKIASILSAYDDLIENNIRRIKILEEMAQAIYKEWFVNFRFPGHEKVKMVDSELGNIPEGWEVATFKDLVNFIKEGTKSGEHLINRIYVPIDCLPRKSLTLLESKSWEEAKSSLLLFNKGDILFGAMRAYFHKVVIAPFDGVTRTTCFILRAKSSEYFGYSVMLAFQEDTVGFANAHSKGATIPYAVWDGSLADMKIVLPSKHILINFNKCISPILNFLQASYLKLNNLGKTRNLLLPKLISGEIDAGQLNVGVSINEQTV